MKLQLLLLLIAVIAVNGLSTNKIPNRHQDYDYDYGIPESDDENLQRKEMNLFDGNEDSTDETEQLNTDRKGSQMLISEDDKGHIEIEFHNGPNTTVQPSLDCESNGGKCQKNKQCNGTISIEYTCSKHGVCCILESKALSVSELTIQMLSNSILIQGIAMQTLKENQENLLKNQDDIISNLTGIDFTIQVLSNSILIQEIAMQTLKENQENLLKNQGIIIRNLSRIGDLEIKLHTMESNINNLTTMMKIDNADLTKKLDYIIRQFQQGLQFRCPIFKGVLSPSQDQCFVFFGDKTRTWAAANSHCNVVGLQLAKPNSHNAVWIRKYVVDNHGGGATDTTWIGGRGDGSYIRWIRNQELLSSSNSLWKPGFPGTNVGNDSCLALASHSSSMSGAPNHPYFNFGCSNARRTLCEAI